MSKEIEDLDEYNQFLKGSSVILTVKTEHELLYLTYYDDFLSFYPLFDSIFVENDFLEY